MMAAVIDRIEAHGMEAGANSSRLQTHSSR